MGINHVDGVANNSNNPKKVVCRIRKIRVQHPQQQGEDFEVELVNDDDKLVCAMCKDNTTFEKMKSLYKHIKKAHSDVEWKTFLNTKLVDMINEAKKKKVVVVVDDSISLMEAPTALNWGLRRKRSLRDEVGVKVNYNNKIAKIEQQQHNILGFIKEEEVKAANSLVLLSQPSVYFYYADFQAFSIQ